MELIVAEKPKVAYTIAKALGGSTVKKHMFGSISYYEFELNGKEVCVAPAVGHLYNLAEKTKSNTYPTFDIEWKPSYEISKSSAFTRGYVKALEMLGKKADMLTVACDYDLEGSVIGYNVYRFCYGKQPGKRMKFSTLVPGELQEAYANAAPEIDFNNAFAGETRHILDWYYGINLSRALMSALKRAGGFRTMSIGRVQGPALDILSTRELEIKNFVPEDYWEVKIFLKNTEFLHEKERFFAEGEANVAFGKIGADAKIGSVQVTQRKIWPYPPFDLTSLQLEAHRCFGIAPSQTLQIAQSLYESSLISYPRTSSQKLPPRLGLMRIVEKLKEAPEYKERAEKILQNGWRSPFQGKKDDAAHPAIHPTGLHAKLEGSEKKMYDLIVSRFLAVFAPPADAESTQVVAETGGEKFIANGARVVNQNWIAFYPYYTNRDKEIAAFTQGSTEKVEKKDNEKKKTKAPPRYTQASIIAELERAKLGTKATRSVIIDTLFKRNYVGERSIEVTDFGMNVWGVLEKYSPKILDSELTRKIEEDMEEIAAGKLQKEKVVEEGKALLIDILSDFKKNELEIGKGLLSAMKVTDERDNDLGLCPDCGSNLRIIRMKMGKQFIGCSGYPNCRRGYPLPQGAYITVLKKKCKDCGMATVKVRRAKTIFEMCIDPKCKSKENWGKKKEEKAKAAEAATAAASSVAKVPAAPAAPPSIKAAPAPPSVKAAPATKPAAPPSVKAPPAAKAAASPPLKAPAAPKAAPGPAVKAPAAKKTEKGKK